MIFQKIYYQAACEHKDVCLELHGCQLMLNGGEFPGDFASAIFQGVSLETIFDKAIK